MDIDSSREAWLFFDSLCGSGPSSGCTDSAACNFNSEAAKMMGHVSMQWTVMTVKVCV